MKLILINDVSMLCISEEINQISRINLATLLRQILSVILRKSMKLCHNLQMCAFKHRKAGGPCFSSSQRARKCSTVTIGNNEIKLSQSRLPNLLPVIRCHVPKKISHVPPRPKVFRRHAERTKG